MRVALMILLGLVIGILGTVNVMNALSARNPMPKAVMETMNYHASALKNALKAQQCDPAKVQQHLARLQSTATDIVPVFHIDEKDFTDHASQLGREKSWSQKRILPRSIWPYITQSPARL